MKSKVYVLVFFIAIGTFTSFAQNTNFHTCYLELKKEFSKNKQPDHILMLEFIKSNISFHYTDNYFWQDSVGDKVNFDELNYTDFNSAVKRFEEIKIEKGKLTPIVVRIDDKHLLTPDILRNNIEATYSSAAFSKYSKDILNNYLLPYRNFSEPIHNWRQIYKDRFIYFKDEKDTKKTIQNIIDNVKQWYLCTYGIEKRADPLPFLGALQILHRKKGGCEDVANLMSFALRSIGIPSSIDIIPYWGTSSGGHVLNSAFDTNGDVIHFDALVNSDSLYELGREPAKVFRKTYAINPNLISNKMKSLDIPDFGLLREKNYIDVTREYCNVSDISFDVPDSIIENIIYASVFNGGNWKPIWFGERRDSIVHFTDMVEGVLYTPYIYSGSKLRAIGHPKAYTNGAIKEFEPSDETHTIILKELPGYLKFRGGVQYGLYYYDNRWIKLGRSVPTETTTHLRFKNVPKNAVLLLKPIDSKGKERPFTIDENGERLWW